MLYENTQRRVYNKRFSFFDEDDWTEQNFKCGLATGSPVMTKEQRTSLLNQLKKRTVDSTSYYSISFEFIN